MLDEARAMSTFKVETEYKYAAKLGLTRKKKDFDFVVDLFRSNEATQAVFRLWRHNEVSQFRFLPIKI